MKSPLNDKRSGAVYVALFAALTSAVAQDLDALAGRCQSGDSSACDSLAGLATGDASWRVRQAAIERLTDQTVLAKCAADDRDFIVRTAAIGRLSNSSSILKSLAGDLNHLTKDARENIARTKLGIADALIQGRFPQLQCSVDANDKNQQYSRPQDQGNLVNSVLGSINLRGELTIIKVTQGSETLASETWATDFTASASISSRLSRENREPLFGVTVSPGRLFTQLLRRPEFTSSDMADLSRSFVPEVRMGVVNNATDQKILARIATKDTDASIRRIAVEKVNDQAVLADVAAHDPDVEPRRGAVQRIEDQALLSMLATTDSDYIVRFAAVRKLIDERLLAKLAVDDKDSVVRKAAAERLAALKK